MAVGGAGVDVSGTGVTVGGIGVGVGGTGVAVGGTGVAGALHPTKSNITNINPIICRSDFWQLIFHFFPRGDWPHIYGSAI